MIIIFIVIVTCEWDANITSMRPQMVNLFKGPYDLFVGIQGLN